MSNPVRARSNDPCPCGSGKKYKRCCHSPSAQAAKRRRLVVTTVGLMALTALAMAGIAYSISRSKPPPGKIWSPEHGHWHDDAPGAIPVQIPPERR